MKKLKPTNAIWRSKFKKRNKLVFSYKIRIHQSKKVRSTGLHINLPISLIFLNFESLPRKLCNRCLTENNRNQPKF